MFNNVLLMGAASTAGAGSFTVDYSVRYNSPDSPRLYRTPAAAGNRKTGSISFWYKRSNLGVIQQLFNAGAGDDITFNASDQLTFIDSSGVSYITTQVFRDTTAWGHLLFAWNTTLDTAGDRLRIYHNGVEITAFDTETNPSLGDEFEISNTVRQTIGANESDTEEFAGYFSQFYYVDSLQLTPTDFGEFSSNNVWRPKPYSITSTGSDVTFTATGSAVDTVGRSTYTWSSVNIGTVTSDRKVVIATTTDGSDYITAMTVGGEGANFLARSTVGSRYSEIWQIDDPDSTLGTSEDIVITMSGTANGQGMCTFDVKGADSYVYDSFTSTADPLAGTVNIPAGGIVIMAMGVGIAADPATGFTFTSGLTERFNYKTEASEYGAAGADVYASFTSKSISIDIDGTAVGANGICISLSPVGGIGRNGFFLDFADSADFGKDTSTELTALAVSSPSSATSSSNVATYTFSSQAIGTASATRRIYVQIVAQMAGAADAKYDSLTVGGITATKEFNFSQNSENHMWISSVIVPTGTTADIVMTFTSSAYNCGIGVWISDGAGPGLFATDTDKNVFSLSTSIDVPAGGWAASMVYSADSPGTWTGLTEDFETTGADARYISGASDAFATAQSALTVANSGGSTSATLITWSVAPAGDNSFLSSGLAADQQVVDTPTNNFPTILRNTSIVTMSEGNLQVDSISSVTWHTVVCTPRLPSTGKWCYEVERINNGVSNHGFLGDTNPQKGDWGVQTQFNIYNNGTAYYLGYAESSQQVDGSASSVSGLVAVANGGKLQMLLDQDAGTITYYANGVLQKEWTGNNTMAYVYVMLYGDSWGVPHCRLDFGQDGFTRVDENYNYICTANFPTPTILDGTKYFQPTLYTGNGSVRNIDQTGNSTFQPDWVWIKNRSAADSNMLFDAPRGVTKVIESDNNDLTSTDANSLTSFDSDGFGLGTGAGGYNDDTENFVAWQWKAGGGAGSSNEDGTINTTTTTVNATSGFSCSTYVGTGSVATVGHGLGAVPAMMVVRNVDAAENWRVYHKDNTTAPETEYLSWANDGATADLDTTWNDTAPTSTVFTVGTSAATNQSTKTMVAYCFVNVEGFSRFGNYIGNGNVRGAPAIVGFKPAYVMIKKTTGTGGWVIYDSQRSPYNEVDDQLLADTTAAETTGSEEIDFLATGFQIRTADSAVNTDNANYVYAAFAEYPFGGEDITPATTF